MPFDLRRAVAAAVLLASVTVSAACGFLPGGDEDTAPIVDIATERVKAENGLDELEPADALGKVMQELQDEGSFHVSGTVSGGALEITYLVGQGAVGTIGDAEGSGSPVEIVAADGRIYVAGDEKFLIETVGEDAAKTIGGKWLLLAEDSATQFDVLADGQKFAEAVFGDWTGEIETTGVREVDGQPAIGFLFRESGSTLWVAASGDPRPLRFEEAGASGGEGVLKFDSIGAEVELKIPGDDDVVDAENLRSD
ncbi:MAG TPA: hypothetical protein VFR23_18625 [Jiangellaceae bacterium]|nr:hypothetical protein [Jiangellaceae bacterium]